MVPVRNDKPAEEQAETSIPAHLTAAFASAARAQQRNAPASNGGGSSAAAGSGERRPSAGGQSAGAGSARTGAPAGGASDIQLSYAIGGHDSEGGSGQGGDGDGDGADLARNLGMTGIELRLIPPPLVQAGVSQETAAPEEPTAPPPPPPQSEGSASAWGTRALSVNLLRLIENPAAHDFAKPIIDHAIESATHEARELIKDQSGLHRFWNDSTLAQDSGNADVYRRKLQALTISNDNPKRVLDAIDDVADAIISDLGKLNPLTWQGKFIQDKLLNSAEQLKTSVHKTAFDNPDKSRLATIALIIGANLGALLPFYAAVAGNPFAAYYLVSLGNAYTRAFGLMVGLMRTPAADARDVTSHFVKRHITWEAAPIAFVATTAARQIYTNQGKDAQAQFAQDLEQSGALIAAVALVSFALYVIPEFISQTKKVYHRAASGVSEGSRLESQFDKGEITLRGQRDLQEAIHGNLAAATTLVSAVDAHRTSWNSAGGPAAAVENQMMSHMRQDLYDLVSAFSKGSEVGPEVGADDGQQAAETPAPRRSDNKFAKSMAMCSLGVGIGLVSSLSAITVSALLGDYVAYYASSVILVAAKGVISRYNAEDVISDWINRFGGTFIRLPIAILNTAFLLKIGEGIFDLTRPGVTTVAPPANAAVPAYPGSRHPTVHVADGGMNFALGMVYAVLATAVYGTRAGPYCAQLLLQTIQSAGFRRALVQDPEAGGAERQDPNAGRFADALISHITDVGTRLLEDRKKTMGEEPKDELAAYMQEQLKQHQERLDPEDAQATGPGQGGEQGPDELENALRRLSALPEASGEVALEGIGAAPATEGEEAQQIQQALAESRDMLKAPGTEGGESSAAAALRSPSASIEAPAGDPAQASAGGDMPAGLAERLARVRSLPQAAAPLPPVFEEPEPKKMEEGLAQLPPAPTHEPSGMSPAERRAAKGKGKEELLPAE